MYTALRTSSSIAPQGESEKLSHFISRTVSLSVSHNLDDLGDSFVRLVQSNRSDLSSSSSIKNREVSWFAQVVQAPIGFASSSTSQNQSEFLSYFGDNSFAPRMGITTLKKAMSYAVQSPGSVVFSDHVYSLSGERVVYMIYVEPSDMNLMYISAVSPYFIKQLHNNVTRGISNVNVSLVDGRGHIITGHRHGSSIVSNNQLDHSELDTSAHGSDYSRDFDINEEVDIGHDLNNDLSSDSMLEEKSHFQLNGNNRLQTHYAHVPLEGGNQWGVFIERSNSLDNPLADRLSSLILPLSAGLVLLALLGSFLLTRFIMCPFNALNVIASKYKCDTRVGLQTLKNANCMQDDKRIYLSEVTNLVKTFKKLSSDLLSYHEKVDDLVEKRTQVVKEEIQERGRIEKQLGYSFTYDQLTGLPNETILNERIEAAVQWSRQTQSKVGLVTLRLDGLCHIRYKYGAIVVDSLIKAKSKYIQSSFNESYFLARTGACEFSLLVIDVKDISKLSSIANQLIELATGSTSFQDNLLSNEICTSIEASIGYAFVDGFHSDTGQNLLSSARASLNRYVPLAP